METEFQKVKVVARIRQSNISETYSNAQAASTGGGNTNPSMSQLNQSMMAGRDTASQNPSGSNARSILTNAIQQTMAANSSLEKDGKVCIFTASSTKEKPIYVAASGNPIKKQLLADYVKTDKNIIQFRHSILENANIFKFDQAMSFKVDNHSLYNDQCKDLVHRSLSQGVSSTFLVTGPAKAGKKFTIKGGEQKDKGILTRTVDDLIDLTKLQSEGAGTKQNKGNKAITIRFGIFAVFNNEIIDLLASSDSKMSEEDDFVEYDLTFSGEYRKQYMKSRERLKSMGGDQTTRRMHILYRFSNYRASTVSRGSKGQSRSVLNTPVGGLISTITIVHCADFCKPKMPEFVVLGDYLSDIATRKDSNLLEIPAYANSTLINTIHDSLNASKDNHCVLICNISGSFDYLSQSVDCLQVNFYLSIFQPKVLQFYSLQPQYCAGIKERIDHFYEDINEFNSEGDQQNLINALTGGPSSDTQIRLNHNNTNNNHFNSSQGYRSQPGGFADTFQQNRHASQLEGGMGLLHVVPRDTTFEFRRLRGPKPTANEIQQDLSNLVKDIYTFTDQTNGLTDEEITAWAQDREAELQSILKDIKSLPAEEQKKFDTASLKIQESLQFLASILKNSFSLSQNKNNNSVQDLRASDDFGSLMSQNNRSRELMMMRSGGSNFGAQDELFKSQMSSQQQGDYTYDHDQLNGKKTPKKLLEQILQKIDEIVQQNENNKRTVRPNQSNNNRRSQNSDSVDHASEKQNRDLSNLKEQIMEYGYAVKEKKQQIKQANEELKGQLAESRKLLANAEKIAEESKGELQYLSDTQVKLKEQIERDREIIQLKIENEEALEKSDEELRNLLQKMNTKLSRRKEECSILKLNIERMEDQVRQERAQIELERESMDQQLHRWQQQREIEQQHVAEIEANKNGMEAELERQDRVIVQLKGSVQDEIERVNQLVHSNEDLKFQLRASQENAESLLDKLAKNKSKGSQELAMLLSERDEELARKKDQIARLKAEIKDATARITDSLGEARHSKSEVQQLIAINDDLEAKNHANSNQIAELEDHLQASNAELKKLRNASLELTHTNANDSLERKRLENENQRLNEKLQKAEGSLRAMGKELEEKSLSLESVKREIRLYDEENIGQKEFISKLERQNQFLSDAQHGDTSKFEDKIEVLQKELAIVRRENKELRFREEEQQKQVQDFRRTSEKQSHQLSQNKSVIKDLTNQLDFLDEKVRDLSNPRSKEIAISHTYQLPSRSVPSSDISTRKTALPSPNGGHRSILKKPRFNLTDDSLDSLDSDS